MSAFVFARQSPCVMNRSSALSMSTKASKHTVAAPLAARHSMAVTKLSTPVSFSQKATTLSRGVAVKPTCKVKGLAQLMTAVEKGEMKQGLMDFKVGSDIKVGVTVVEGSKTRVQNYQGVIIAIRKHGSNIKNGMGTSITVRKVVQGVGVERVFPIHSPLCTFEEVPGSGTVKVRRAKLYYLRELMGKSAKLKRKF